MRLTTLLIVTLLTVATYAQDISWWFSNQESETFEISTASQLKGLADLVNQGVTDFDGKIISLKNDIALTGDWTPIGDDTKQFKGVFDGQNNIISGLSVNGGDYAGLFGYVGENGQIKNINVVASIIKGTRYAGGLAGYYFSAKTIESCSVQADSVIASGSGNVFSGGLVGIVVSAGTVTIKNSYAIGNVSAFGFGNLAYSGGLVGRVTVTAVNTTNITNSYTKGNVSAFGSSSEIGSGGLVGHSSGTINKTNSYSTGNVSSNGTSGGLVGRSDGPVDIKTSYSTGNVSSTDGSVSCGTISVTEGSSTTTINN